MTFVLRWLKWLLLLQPRPPQRRRRLVTVTSTSSPLAGTAAMTSSSTGVVVDSRKSMNVCESQLSGSAGQEGQHVRLVK